MPHEPINYAFIALGRATLELGWPHRAIPDSHPETYLWLRVHARMSCPEGNWSFIDESLTAAEAHQLITWLLTTPTDQPTMSFTEPCLSFAAIRGQNSETVSLAITFRGEASPPWIADTDAAWADGWTLRGETTMQQLHQFATSLARMLR